MSKEDTPTTEALAPVIGFGELPAIPEPSTCAPGAVPYLGFFDRRSSRALEIQAMMPGITEGDPYLGVGMLYQDLAGAKVIIAAVSSTFWVEYEADWVTPKQVSQMEFQGSKEAIVTAGIAAIGEDLFPFVATLRTTKCAPAKVAYSAAAASEKAGWADNKVKTGLLKLPAMMRHYGVLTTTQKSGSYGPYFVARWVPQPLTVELATAVNEWLKTAEKDILAEEFSKRVSEYQNKVGAVAKEA